MQAKSVSVDSGALSPLFASCPRSGDLPSAGRRHPVFPWKIGRGMFLLGLTLFAALSVPVRSADGAEADAALVSIIDLAGRQPDEAQRLLSRWQAHHPVHQRGTAALVDLAQERIADAQDRAVDVLEQDMRFRLDADAATPPRFLALAAHARANALFQLDRFSEMRQALIEEEAAARSSGDTDLEATANVNWTRYYVQQVDFSSAAGAIARAERLARGPAARAEVAYNDFVFARRIEDFTRARQSAQEALDLFRKLSDRLGTADALLALGIATLELGNSGEAIALLSQAQIDYRDMKDELGVAESERQLAKAYLNLGRIGPAVLTARAAVVAFERDGSARSLSAGNITLSLSQTRSGNIQHCLQPLVQPAKFIEASSDSLTAQDFHSARAACLRAQGNASAALDEMQLAQDAAIRYRKEVVSHQVAAQRGLLEFERIQSENHALRTSYSTSQAALEEVTRARDYQRLALALFAILVVATALLVLHQRKLMRRLAALAQTDSMTGLLNRRAFVEQGANVVEACLRNERPVTLLMLDADHFKAINDQFGHAEGDNVLMHICAALRHAAGPDDLLCRLGGEEFAAILEGRDGTEGLGAADGIRAAVSAFTLSAGNDAAMQASVSIGVTSALPSGDTLAAMLRRADLALYRAKDKGRNRSELA